MSTTQLLGGGIAAASIGSWVLAYRVALLVTRPARPAPAPPTQDLGTEPPAVVGLLTGGWAPTEDAHEATLIDLAARRYLEFRQPGNDPAQTTVHIRDAEPAGLTRYEQMIFDRVLSLATGGVVPLTALAFRDPAQAIGFTRRLDAAVVADCRRRGLSRRRFGPAQLSTLTVMALGCAAGLALASMLALHLPLLFACAVWFLGAGILAGIGNRSIGERDTPAGREACARWLGVQTWLRNTEAFAELPPAAVAVWDRYLAYGAALGTTQVTSAVIDLGAGSRRRIWSSHGGTWHQVHVRYPRFWPRCGSPVRPLVVRGTVSALAGGLLLSFGARIAAAFPNEALVNGRTVTYSTEPARDVIPVVGAFLLVAGLYVLTRAIIDAARPATHTGQVLLLRVWRTVSNNSRSQYPRLYHLVLDDGHGDATTAWGLPSGWATRCGDGDTVRVTVHPWSRRVVELDVLERSAARRQAEASPVEVDTESLVGAELGRHSTMRDGDGTPLPATELLLTADEVSRAVGVPVTMHGIGTSPSPGADENTVRFRDTNGHLLVTLAVSDGFGARALMRMHRGGQPQPGLGNEAYLGDRRVVARAGDLAVMVSARSCPWPVDPRNLCWLLALALSRLSPTAVPGPDPRRGPGSGPQLTPPGWAAARRTTSKRTQLLVAIGLLLLCCVGSAVSCCAGNIDVNVHQPDPSASSSR